MSAGKYLVYLTIITTFVLIVWGAYLTAGGWGAACGSPSSSPISSDWPYCNGSLAIPSHWPALVEYIHRTLSVVVSLVLLVTTIAVWRIKPRPTGPARALLLAVFLLIIQILLGGVEVNTALNPGVTALHLANATALFGVIVVAGTLMYMRERSK